MILEYHRPTTLDAALALLARQQPPTVPLAGGTAIHHLPHPVAVVDLQSLGLDTHHRRGNFIDLGATLPLQALLELIASSNLPQMAALEKVILHQATHNVRQVASVAGTLVAGDGRSPFTVACLALDATLTLLPGAETVRLGEVLPVREKKLAQRLISRVSLPANARLAYEYVARSPADWPVVCAAVAVWAAGRTRVVLGGYGSAPQLALDGTEADGAVEAARSAYSQAGDQWASAAYRQEMAGILVQRCIEQVS